MNDMIVPRIRAESTFSDRVAVMLGVAAEESVGVICLMGDSMFTDCELGMYLRAVFHFAGDGRLLQLTKGSDHSGDLCR